MASTPEAIHGLGEIDRGFEVGEYAIRTLTLEEAKGIIIPGHLHTPTGDILIPAKGLTLEEAVNQIYAIPDYKHRNPKCTDDLYRSANSDDPVYLSPTIPAMADYARVEPTVGHLYFIDGDLHQLLGRGHMYGYDELNYNARPIVAYIAGPSKTELHLRV